MDEYTKRNAFLKFRTLQYIETKKWKGTEVEMEEAESLKTE